jgi:A/G-specific adenine glycosylase
MFRGISAAPPFDAKSFRHILLRWFQQKGRYLPWRRTRDPYAILVSEVMLQQTQVTTVLPYYDKWLQRFPNFHSLAAATESDVLHAWQGLGYYARARNLHAAAKTIVAQHHGAFPQRIEDIQTLPGLGRYTANAVATFAFDRSVPVVEANIARLLARVMNLQLPIDSAAGNQALWHFAATLVPKQHAGRFNSALMDLGAIVCVARAPKCGACPVRSFCATPVPNLLPLKKGRIPTKRLVERHAFLVRRDKILLEQSTKRWRGMWMLPRLADSAAHAAPLYAADFPFTHHRITLEVHPVSLGVPQPTDLQRWFALDSLGRIPLPSPHRRALSHLLAHPPPDRSSTSARMPRKIPACGA